MNRLPNQNPSAAIQIPSGISGVPSGIAEARTRRESQESSAFPARPIRALLVVAHPDDEYYCAASIFRLTRELNATVDQLTVTNGEGGFRFSHLAEQFYGLCLTNQEAARDCLPAIRRREALAASRILGIRKHHFLEQHDERNEDESHLLEGAWNRELIQSTLRALLSRDRYDVILTLLPTKETHPHHRLVTQLVLDVVAEQPLQSAPLVLGAEPGASVGPMDFHLRESDTLISDYRLVPDVVFDRHTSVGAERHASYDVVVNWVIAEHKSQGLFQHEVGRHQFECFWLLNRNVAGAARRLQQLREHLNPVLRWPVELTA